MKTSARPREIGGSFASRRGHAQKLSISDLNHHVTEAIGDMYGDDNYPKPDAQSSSYRPTSPSQEAREANSEYFDPRSDPQTHPQHTAYGHSGERAPPSPGVGQRSRNNSVQSVPFSPSLSPSLSLREHNTTDTANAQFPLNNIDYESIPAAVAQELSNLQALRRMSMDIGITSDPDLPKFQGSAMMPPAAPRGNDKEDDPSRLFWVPARVHPELAPMEFKTFVENRVQSIRRQSGEQTSLSPDGLDRSGSEGGLRRKKSKLSRQIDNSGGRGAVGYHDGSEQLERKKSLSNSAIPELRIADLKDLDSFVQDSSEVPQNLHLDTGNGLGAGDTQRDGDILLPQAPGIGLRRSKNTTYRKGSVKRGERIPYSRRAASIQPENDADISPTSSPIEGHSGVGYRPIRAQSDPSAMDNFSRPNRGARRVPGVQQLNANIVTSDETANSPGGNENLSSRMTSDGVSSTTFTQTPPLHQYPLPAAGPRNHSSPRVDAPVPEIVETPPQQEKLSETRHTYSSPYPARSSSQNLGMSQQKQPPLVPIPEPPARSNKRPQLEREASLGIQSLPNVSHNGQTLSDLTQHPSPLPGSSASTETLTFIPTFDEKKQPEKKSKKEKDDNESTHSKKAGWGWFKGSDEKEKKEKKKQEEEFKDGKKGKNRTFMEKAHDNARLDVLQSTMETASTKGRESPSDRDSLDNKLQDERKKESSRKSSETKKEKDGLFSSIFGGKKKADKNASDKKASSLRALSPDPPHRRLRPDIDYNWTRFSILEERAIYRMAHIKLANPRRALYSQVLLSNFMYAYLAKVQQMHPHMQIPQSMAQKRAEAEKRQQELQQQQRQQQEAGGQYQYDYHQGITQYAETSQNRTSEGAPYVDDSQIYHHDHQGSDSDHSQRPDPAQSRGPTNTYNQNHQYSQDEKGYYSYGDQQGEDDDDDEDIW